MPTTSLHHRPCSFRHLSVAQPLAPCPRCKAQAPRVWDATRVVVDIALEQLALLLLQVSVHHCSLCQRFFRFSPSFIRPDATYTNRVVQKAIHSVFDDGMPFSRVPERLARDFWVRPSEASVRLWCRTYTKGLAITESYEPWVVASFSGVLCVDEVYQDKLALLLAVDPRSKKGDRLIGYALVHGDVEQKDVEAFLIRLRQLGINPEEVITDGSTLYPGLITAIWPKAVHQLCLFHETKNVLESVLKALKELRGQLPKAPKKSAPGTGRIPRKTKPDLLHREQFIAQVHQLKQAGYSSRAISRETGHSRNTIKVWLKRQPPCPTLSLLTPLPEKIAEPAPEPITVKTTTEPTQPPAPWTDWKQVREVYHQLFKDRYLLVSREEHLTAEEKLQLQALFTSPIGASVQNVRDFVRGWYGVWYDEKHNRRSWEDAHGLYKNLGAAERFHCSLYLKRLQERMTDGRFEWLSQFLKKPEWEATSNGAERMGRTYRHLQASQFELRSTESREGALKAYMMRSKEKAECTTKSQAPRSSRGRKPKTTEPEKNKLNRMAS